MPDARLDYINAWQAANPERVREYKQKHKAKKRAEREASDPGYTYKPAVVFTEEERKRRKRAKRLVDDYNLTHEQYEQMFEAQGGVCAICRQPETAKSRTGALRFLAVDHNHETGDVRGLLCNACNTAIGYFKESTDSMMAAIEYLGGR